MHQHKYPSVQQDCEESHGGPMALALEATGGRKRTHFNACRHRTNTLRAVPIVLGDPESTM